MEHKVDSLVTKFQTYITSQEKTPLSLTNTVVTEAAVRGTWWSEDFASKAILQFDCLAVDGYFFCPGRRPVTCTAISHI